MPQDHKSMYPIDYEWEYITATEYHIPYFAPGELDKIENYDKANASKFVGWHLHHRLEINPDGTLGKSRETLIAENLYYYRPATELIFLPSTTHQQLHTKAGYLSRPNRTTSSETRALQSQAKLKANNTDARFAVVSAMVESGQTLSFTDYAFYRRYCQRNGLEFKGARVDKSGTLIRVDVPKVPSEKQLRESRYECQKKRYANLVEQAMYCDALPKSDIMFLRRYCRQNNMPMPLVKMSVKHTEPGSSH